MSDALRLKLAPIPGDPRTIYYGVQMIKSRNPEDRSEKKTKSSKWDHNKVACGSQWRGWKAGSPFGAWVHYIKKGTDKRSVPCLTEMTSHALACPHCNEGLVPDWRGYVPYYDEQYTPWFFLITFDYHESVVELEHLTPILIRRGVKATDPIVCERKVWRTTPIPFSEKRSNPIDLGPFLVFTLWGNEALIEWCKRVKYTPKEEATPKPIVVHTNSVPESPVDRLARREKELLQENELAGELAAELINKALTPKPNGSAFKRPR